MASPSQARQREHGLYCSEDLLEALQTVLGPLETAGEALLADAEASNERAVQGSPYWGVHLQRSSGRWQAKVRFSGKKAGRSCVLGYYDSDVGAARAVLDYNNSLKSQFRRPYGFYLDSQGPVLEGHVHAGAACLAPSQPLPAASTSGGPVPAGQALAIPRSFATGSAGLPSWASRRSRRLSTPLPSPGTPSLQGTQASSSGALEEVVCLSDSGSEAEGTGTDVLPPWPELTTLQGRLAASEAALAAALAKQGSGGRQPVLASVAASPVAVKLEDDLHVVETPPQQHLALAGPPAGAATSSHAGAGPVQGQKRPGAGMAAALRAEKCGRRAAEAQAGAAEARAGAAAAQAAYLQALVDNLQEELAEKE